MFRSLVLIVFLFIHGSGSAVGLDSAPRRVHIGLIAPDVVGITLEERAVVYGQQTSYEVQAGDVINEDGFPHRWLYRDGEPIGSIAGKNRDILMPFDSILGDAWK